MKIGVNTRLLQFGRLEGIGRFMHETLSRLVQLMPQDEFIFYFDRPYHSSFIYHSNVYAKIVPPPARHPFLYWIWLEWALPFHFKKDKINVFYSPDGFLSLSTSVPQIAVFHDLAFEHFPQGISKIGAWYYKKYMPQFAQKAYHLLAVSEFTKNDIIQTYKIRSEKISVTCNGVSEVFKPLDDKSQELIKQKYSKGKPYILYVGSIHPRKNLGRLLQAFEKLKTENSSDIQLLICGRKAWNFEEVFDFFKNMKFKEEVHFTGVVSDEQLSSIYASASVVCYISLFEGFGIPILEAFASHVPVITSNLSAMPEVAGSAAWLVNPYDIDEIQNAIFHVINNSTLRTQMVQKGIERLSYYSWDKATEIIKNTLTVSK